MRLRFAIPYVMLLSLFSIVPCLARQAESKGEAPEDQCLAQIKEALKDTESQNAEKREAAEGKIRESVDQLLVSYKGLAPEKQKAVVAAMGKIFSARTPDDQNSIYKCAAVALSEMGPDGEAQLLKAMKVSHLEKRIDVQCTLVEALGKHKDEKQIDFLIKLLLKDDPKLVKSAVIALGEYRESDGKVRKKIAEALIREYAKTHNADNAAKGKDATAHERLLEIEVPMNSALDQLTLKQFQSAPEWEKWFNDNRNKNW